MFNSMHTNMISRVWFIFETSKKAPFFYFKRKKKKGRKGKGKPLALLPTAASGSYQLGFQ